MPSRLLTEVQVVAIYGFNLSTLRNWRIRGGGPPYYKISRSVRYSSEDLDAWIATRRRRSTADLGNARDANERRSSPEIGAIARKIIDSIGGEWETNHDPLEALVLEVGTEAVEEATAEVVAMIRRRERFRRGPLAHLIDEARRIAARRESEARMNDGSG